MAERKAEFEHDVAALGLEQDIALIKETIEQITSVFGKPAGLKIETTEGKRLWPR